MGEIAVNDLFLGDQGTSVLGTPLTKILMADNIELGSKASYELCKIIYSYHPLGAKLVDAPIQLAQSQGRILNIPGKSEDRVRKAFLDEWKKLNCDRVIANVVRLARIYGIASVAVIVKEDKDPSKPLDFASLANKKISFNVFDPLNTAGSLVLNQNPNEISFLKPLSIAVQGVTYNSSRTCVYMNEDPIYLDYTSSSYGYVGRSVFQRALFPLKSFLQSMLTDDLVTKKAGLIVAKLKQPGSIINNVMQSIAGVKRNLLKIGVTGNVLSVAIDEAVESLNLQNIDTSMKTARKNVLDNIAAAAGMPAKLVNSETLAVAFAEGEEDAKAIARYIDDLRESMQVIYDYFDRIVQFRAWNFEFFQTIKTDFPEEYGGKTYNQAFTEWVNHFIVTWPSLLTEPDSEKIKVANVKLRSIISMIEELYDRADPDNKAILLQWASDNFNDLKILFPSPLDLDTKKMAKFKPDPETLAVGGKKKNVGGLQSRSFGGGSTGLGVTGRTDDNLFDDSVVDLLEEIEDRRKRQQEKVQKMLEITQ